jgi:hypothetical protein
MNEYLEIKTDYTIVLKYSFLTFLLYWLGVPFYFLYAFMIFFIFIDMYKKKYPELYSNVITYVLLFCGIGIIVKLSLLCNHRLRNLDEFRLIFD